MILQIISINLSRNKKIVFKNFGLKVNKPEIITFIGNNGAGKTSLLETIVGLLRPESGCVKINGVNIEDLGNRKKTEFIYIPYQDSLKGNLTIKENLEIWGNMADVKFDQNALDRKLYHFSLLELKNVLVSKLSQGQKKKVSLVKLMLTNCKLWILDEPFNSLDLENIKILENLFLMHKKNGGVVLLASHIDMKIKKNKKIFLEIPKIKNSTNIVEDNWEILK